MREITSGVGYLSAHVTDERLIKWWIPVDEIKQIHTITMFLHHHLKICIIFISSE